MYTIEQSERWLARQILSPDEYDIFLRDPIFMRNILKSRIFEQIRFLISQSSQSQPPFSPQKLFPFRKINMLVSDEDISPYEAKLVPTHGGFVMKIDPRKPAVRVRISCAHEIGHTYFFDLTTNPPQKFYNVLSSRRWVEDGYAREIAREILMPEPYMYNVATRLATHPSFQALEQLKQVFNVSYEALIPRLLHDAHSWNRRIWGSSLWEALAITSEVIPNNRNSRIKHTYYRSPAYKNRLRGILEYDNIRRIVNCASQNGSLISDSFRYGKSIHRVESKIVRGEPQMLLILIYKEAQSTPAA